MNYAIGLFVLVGIVALAIAVGTADAPTTEPSAINAVETEEASVEHEAETTYVVDESDLLDSETLVTDVAPAAGLTEAEIDGLLLMREEEKLARDVYEALYEQWGMPIFSNIAASERTHTEAMKVLLDRYGVADPMVGEVAGVFVDVELQALYDSLVAEGSQSLLAALQVGATVEDLDIYDLEQLMMQTDKADITLTYENLQKGSRNHLRAFNRQIERQGGTYTPQYITQAEFEAIIAAEQERGMMR